MSGDLMPVIGIVGGCRGKHQIEANMSGDLNKPPTATVGYFQGLTRTQRACGKLMGRCSKMA